MMLRRLAGWSDPRPPPRAPGDGPQAREHYVHV